nr:RecName: Full=[Val1,Hyp2,Thr6]-bradykinyl-Gln,Ser; AltName: Full=[Val1,Hyp2,Thr6]-bradykinin-Gln,Ser [Pithecopus azureus]
VPPGFTPFRQS